MKNIINLVTDSPEFFNYQQSENEDTIIHHYSKIIAVNQMLSEDNIKQSLEVIDQIVQKFGESKKFDDYYYLWNRESKNQITLVKRSREKLTDSELSREREKIELLIKTIEKSLAKKFS